LRDQVAGDETRFPDLTGGQIAGEAVQVDPRRRGIRQRDGLRQQPPDDARQDVAGAAGRHAGIAGGIDPESAVGIGEERVRPFEHDPRPVPPGRFARRRGFNLRYAVVVGSGELATTVVRRIRARPDLGIQILGVVGDRKEEVGGATWLGGYADLPLMEDVDLSRRLRRAGAYAPLRLRVSTSGRRWEDDGLVRTILLMWRLRLAFWWGADAARLAELYARRRPGRRADAAADDERSSR